MTPVTVHYHGMPRGAVETLENRMPLLIVAWAGLYVVNCLRYVNTSFDATTRALDCF